MDLSDPQMGELPGREVEMENDQRVEVLLHGDDTWYTGTVIKARKQWVQLEGSPGGAFIADECSIKEWRPTCSKKVDTL